MELTEIVEVARNISVMVKIHGPDPKGLKMRRHAFHLHESGKTTLSASGMVIPDSLGESPIIKHLCGYEWQQHLPVSWSTLVLTTASIVEPFLRGDCRHDPSVQVLPNLIPGAQINVLAESKKKAVGSINDLDCGTPEWLPAQLLAVVDVPASSLAVQSLVKAHGSLLEHGWDVGWSLAPLSNSTQPVTDALQTTVRNEMKSSLESQMFSALDISTSRNRVALSITRIALLGVATTNLKDLSHINVSLRGKKGDLLLAMGSPFGALSPLHFLNSISVGVVSNCCPPDSADSSLLMADLRCLPGMEGGPVFGDHAHLIGILTRPLRQRAGGAEVQLVITWDAIATAASDRLQRNPERAMKNQGLCNEKKLWPLGKAGPQESMNYMGNCPVSLRSEQLPFEKVLSSVVLITVGDGAWASGIILNNHGLILTNAHLLEPWRFGKMDISKTPTSTILFEKPACEHEETEGRKITISDASIGEEDVASTRDSMNKSYKRICVRLDHVEPRIWCDARVVYISKGPVDIALVQLESLPSQLCPIVPHFTCPSPGSKVLVIGHGLFGPQSGLLPSISSGVVARVVEIQKPLHFYESGVLDNEERRLPVMIETTAAVHPGVSGGAVVNSDGLMIGLVTSNARHRGGTVIPHLNFSIPCAALKSVFEFSKDMQDPSVLRAMDKPNEFLSSVWALKPLPPTPSPSLQRSLLEKSNEGKGTRFARFLAEKQSEFSQASQNQPTKAVKFSTSLPSKL
ncbi:hypothetical protein AAC387_Pa02g1461 [Persea americana]